MVDMSEALPVRQLAFGFVLPRCLHVIAQLGVADLLGDEPQTPEDLARATGTDPESLRRVMRTLASAAVFEDLGDRFGHSPASRFLRSDHPQSMLGLVRFAGADYQWATWGALEHSVRTGRPGFDHIYGCNSFAYFKANPEAGRVFDQAMTGVSIADIDAAVRLYDFSRFATVADIGGGAAHFLRAVLEAAPGASGVLLDLPEVAESSAAEPHPRIAFRGGDFFQDALPRCDAYLLMKILHDWDDTACVALLRNIRRAAGPDSRVIVVEQFLPDTPGPGAGKIVDIEMLVLTGGRERTTPQYRALLAAGGFELLDVTLLPTGMALTEAGPIAS